MWSAPIPPIPAPGWQCPCCRAIYAPTTAQCTYCNPSYQTMASGAALIHYCPVPEPAKEK